MEWLRKIGARLRKGIGVIIILVLLCIFFALYFFKFIPGQQQLLNGRAFRELEQIGNGLDNKNDAYAGAIQAFLKKRSANNPLRNTFQFTIPFPPQQSYDNDSFCAGSLQLKRNDQTGSWQLAYPLYRYQGTKAAQLEKDRVVTEMRAALGPILQPIITTYKDIFNDYLILRQRQTGDFKDQMPQPDSTHSYEVAFTSGALPVDYRLQLDSLLKKDDGFNLITIHDVTIEGTPCKLFVYPLQLGSERIILAGIIDLAAYKKGYKTIPFNLALTVGILVLLLFIHLPVLKIYVLGKYERIRGFDMRMIISTYFIAAFLVFFLFSRIFLNHVQSMHNFSRLKDLSGQVEKNFVTEIDSVCRQLRQWDTSNAIWSAHSDAFFRLLKKDTSMRLARSTDSSGSRAYSTDRRLVDSLFNLSPRPYPYADYVFWIDSLGNWISTWNNKRQYNRPDLLVVKDRPYFKDIVGFNILTLPNTHPPDSFTIQPTLSRLDGEYTVNIVIPSRAIPGRPSRMIGLSTPMFSVDAPQLPYGYNFSIIDGQGDILYDSKPGRALLSNIGRETESPSDILAPLRYHSKRYFSSFILQGRPKALLVTPLKGFPYSLLVYYDLAGSDDFQAHLIGLSGFFGACVLILLIASSVIKEWFEKRPVLLRTPTRHFEWLQPTHTKERYYRHLIRAMLFFLLLFFVIWTVFECFALSSEFSLFYISLLFPFYIALHYYLLREKQKYKIFVWPNYPLLAFMGIVIVSINVFACLGTRSAFLPLLLAQLVFAAAIFFSVRLFQPIVPKTPGHWRGYYYWSIVIGVIMINIIPTSSIFWLIFRQESVVQSNTTLLTMAGSLDERRTLINQRISAFKLSLTNHSRPQEFSRDSLDLHRLKFQNGVYTLGSDHIAIPPPQQKDTAYPISAAYTQIHRWLFPGDSTALAWPANPNYATDSTWVFLHGGPGKWSGPGLLYYNQRDAIENNALLIQTDATAALSSFGLMRQETFTAASGFYTVFYFGGILIILVLLLALTRSLTERVFLLDLLKRKFPHAADTAFLDQLLGQYDNSDVAASVTAINDKERVWWSDPIANEQRITESVDDLGLFYSAVWQSLSEIEQFTLYDFAIDGFTNYKNSNTLTDLINRHILLATDGERLRFMTPGFREWILRTPDNGAFSAIASKGMEEGYWENIKRPLLLLLAIPGVFIFVTQDDISQKVTGFLTALTPLLPLISSFFPKKQEDK
jgi:hypothetical protein